MSVPELPNVSHVKVSYNIVAIMTHPVNEYRGDIGDDLVENGNESEDYRLTLLWAGMTYATGRRDTNRRENHIKVERITTREYQTTSITKCFVTIGSFTAWSSLASKFTPYRLLRPTPGDHRSSTHAWATTQNDKKINRENMGEVGQTGQIY